MPLTMTTIKTSATLILTVHSQFEKLPLPQVLGVRAVIAIDQMARRSADFEGLRLERYCAPAPPDRVGLGESEMLELERDRTFPRSRIESFDVDRALVSLAAGRACGLLPRFLQLGYG
jgi:hypothetical protein